MPKTRFQEFIFSIMMSITMAYAMELYNLALNQGGLSNHLFLEVFKDMFFMAVIVFFVEKLIAGKLAHKLAFRIVNSKEDKPIFVILAIQCMTVCIMSSIMSLIATLIFKHPGDQFFAIWIQTLAFNFPMALFWQVFFAGPTVRFIFRILFSKQLSLQKDSL